MSDQANNTEILENRTEWHQTYRETWLAHLLATGEADYKGRYMRPKNKSIPGGPGINLAESRLLLISTAGGFLRDEQSPFEKDDLLGDYSIRLLPSSTPLEEVEFAHEHYDRSAVQADPQVLLPLRHLEALVADGVIGDLSSFAISFSGYQPDATRTVDEVIPEMLRVAQEADVQGALLVPA